MRTQNEIKTKIEELKNTLEYYKTISDAYMIDYLKEISINGVNSGGDLKKKVDFTDHEMRKVEEHLKILNWVVG
jgi:hypothetical protein